MNIATGQHHSQRHESKYDAKNQEHTRAQRTTVRVILPELLFQEIGKKQVAEAPLPLIGERRIQIIAGCFGHPFSKAIAIKNER